MKPISFGLLLLGALLLSSACQATPAPQCYIKISCVNEFEEKVVATQQNPVDATSPCVMQQADSDICSRICSQQSSMVSTCNMVLIPTSACTNPPCGVN